MVPQYWDSAPAESTGPAQTGPHCL